MAFTIDDLYTQLLGAMPAVEPPVLPQSPYLSPQESEAMGLPFPTSLMGAMPAGELPESAQPDPMLGVTSAFGAPPTASTQYGYQPQARPMLPAAITDRADSLYGPFRQVWEGLQAEPDPLAALMAPPPAEPEPRHVPDLPWRINATQPTWGQGGTQQPSTPQAPPPTPQERAMQSRYPRAMSRIMQLRGIMARKGM